MRRRTTDITCCDGCNKCPTTTKRWQPQHKKPNTHLSHMMKNNAVVEQIIHQDKKGLSLAILLYYSGIIKIKYHIYTRMSIYTMLEFIMYNI